jgi:hypothetical protein
MRLFQPDLEPRGGRLRPVAGLVLVLGTFGCCRWPLAAASLGVSGAFVLFEAWRGWCVLRACAIKKRQ